MASRLSALSLLIAAATAQQIGPYQAEVHPSLTTWECTTSGGCVAQNTSVVIDANYRWVHQVGGYNSCTGSSGLNSTICPNATACGMNCALEGVTYASSGISTNGSSITLDMFVGSSEVSPRVYLLGPDGDYVNIQLLGREISFNANVSALPCGMNGALYMAQMDPTGGRNNSTNPAGANYGTGYCDAQCGIGTWLDGEANLNGLGSCCSEMDLWEANSAVTAVTPHVCNATGFYACNGTTDCGYNGVCDQYGCGYNAYAQGSTNFYGPGLTVDTTKPFTVVTQFLTDDNTTTGTLTAIKRLYVQDGTVIEVPDGSAGTNEITDSFCGSDGFELRGGLKAFGDAIAKGMVLVFSIWDDSGSYMNWLDSGSNGPCTNTSGIPSNIQANYPNTQVTWSEVKWGELGSTYSTASA